MATKTAPAGTGPRKARRAAGEPKVKRVVTALPGWISLPRAARILDVTRQGAWEMVQDFTFTEVYMVEGAGDRPALILVRTDEVTALKEKQDEQAAKADAREVPAEEAVLAG